MDFMSRVFAQKSDDNIHRQFVRFGKGVFENRALICWTRLKEIKINSSFEYAHDFLEFISELTQKIRISGIVLSKEPVAILGTGAKKVGLHKYKIDKEISAKELQEILSQSYSALLDASTEGIEFKCKKKLPKPGKGEGKVDDKFCVLNLNEKYAEQARQYFFPYAPANAKKVKTKYIMNVEDIGPPAGETDFEKMRLLAKRKGKITRIAEIDKQEQRKEIEFCV